MEILVHKKMINFGQKFEFMTIVLLPRASHPDTQMTEVISLRSNRAKDCPGKSNSFPQKFAKILTFHSGLRIGIKRTTNSELLNISRVHV